MRMDDVTIVCKAYGRDDASGLADAVEAALNDYSGTPSGGVTIHAMILTDRYHQAEATDTGTDKRLFLTILEYQVQHS